MFSQQASNTISRQPSNITALSSVSKDFTVEHPSSVELQLNDSNLLAAYDEFAEVSQPIFARNLFLVAILLIHSFALILSYIPEFRDNSISSVENGLLGLAVVTVIASVLFAACAYKARKSDTSKASVFIRKFISCSGLYSLFALSFTVSLCSHLLMRAVAGQCQKTERKYFILQSLLEFLVTVTIK